jgi:hypothetical protein
MSNSTARLYREWAKEAIKQAGWCICGPTDSDIKWTELDASNRSGRSARLTCKVCGCDSIFTTSIGSELYKSTFDFRNDALSYFAHNWHGKARAEAEKKGLQELIPAGSNNNKKENRL